MQKEELDSALHGPWRAIANQCNTGSCPTVYTDGKRFIVQGFALAAEGVGLEVPDGELLVEVPFELLAEAVRNLP